MRTLLLLAAMAALAACQQSPEQAKIAPVTQQQAETIVAQLDKSYTGRCNQIMAQYADSAVMFDQGLLAPVVDRQLQTKITQGFAAAASRLHGRQPHHPGARCRNFVNSGVTNFTIQLGQSRQPVRARFTQVYQRQGDGNFKIAHEHMSAPPAGSPLP